MNAMDEDKRSVDLERNIEPELIFLISKYLSMGPCQRAAQALKEEIEEHKLMSKRLDWEGSQHPRSILDVEKNNPHIRDDHLLKICARIGPILEKEIPSSVSGVSSLLGAGNQSLLRRKTDEYKNLSTFLNVLRHGSPSLPSPKSKPNYPHNIVNALSNREYGGILSIRQTLPCKIYTKQNIYRRLLGHLSSVYCISFDRTGQFIFTGADDLLVKIWSATDGRLLATLRGHAAEITDLAVNYENTLLAAGSCDKMIRIWSLRTTEPITVLTGHTGMITSLKFCPFVKNNNISYLVSTANDGSVCFWSWNTVTYDFQPKPLKLIEKTKQGAQLICSSFSSGGVFLAVGSTDHYVRVYHVFAPNGPEKVLEIESHSDQVDSIQFCNLGCRFISGSKDGNAYIWTYEKRQWINRALKMTENLSGNNALKEGDTKVNKYRVNMVGWTCDDAYVITAISDNSLKVWDSNTTKLQHVLLGHEDEVFVIEAHPSDSRVFLSGGHDGKIILWDVDSGCQIKCFLNSIEGQGHGAIFDCKFSPDGQMFASTDSHGHLSIYGFGSIHRYEKVPSEVFFHTDYRPLIRDVNHYVIDEQTQCPPHLMPPPFLVDIDGNPYAPELQRLVPGRETCKDEQLVPYIAIQNERGVGEVLEPVMRNGEFEVQDLQQPLPTPPVNNNQRPTIDDMIERLQQQHERQRVHVEHGYAASPAQLRQQERNSRRYNQSSSQPNDHTNPVGMRISGDVEGVRQPSVNWLSRDRPNLPTWAKRVVVKPLPQSSLKKFRKQIHWNFEFEQDNFRREKKKKPLTENNAINNPKQQRFTRRKKRINEQRHGLIEMMSPVRARSITNRRHPGIIDYENPEDLLTADDSASNLSGSGVDSWEESGSESSNVSDEDFEFNSEEEAKEVRAKIIRTSRAKMSQDDEDNSDSDNVEEKKLKQKEGKKSKKLSQKATALYDSITELPENFKLPEWLTDVYPKRSPYFPQMGDEVYYFRKGHQKYLDIVIANEIYSVTKTIPKRKNAQDPQLGRIIEIKYQVKPPRLVTLKLEIMKDNILTKETITIRYHDMPDVIDFLVLRQIYETAMEREWKVGDQFKSIIDDKWWFGEITNFTSPNDQFQTVDVLWSNGEKELMSLWDFEPVTDSCQCPDDPNEGIPLTPTERNQVTYIPQIDDWPPCGVDAECNRLAHGLEKIMALSIAEHFNVPVDLNIHPVYGMMISYPMDFSTIKNRIENRFYRRIDAIKFDIGFIKHNAKEYNEPHSDIVKKSKLLTNLCLEFIDDPSCEDPMTIYQRLCELKENSQTDDENTNEEEAVNRDGRNSRKRKAGEMKASHNRNKASKRLKLENKEITSNTWKKQCKELIIHMFECEDSAPFRFPVDPISYPDYNTSVDTPMDLSTVKEQLVTDCYTNPNEFCKDMKLIFHNSKNYNTNKRSKIYSMTVRLSAMFDEKMKEIYSDWRSAKCHEKRSRRKKAYKPKDVQHKKVKKKKTFERLGRNSVKVDSNNHSTDDDDPLFQPSTSGYSKFKANLSLNNKTQKRKINKISSDEEEKVDCQFKPVNGHVKRNLMKQIHSDEETEEEAGFSSNVLNGNNQSDDHMNSETEIDTDATLIEEDHQSNSISSKIERSKNRMKAKYHSNDSESYSNGSDSSFHSVSANETVSDSSAISLKTRTDDEHDLRGNKVDKRRTRNKPLKYSYAEDSDFEYERQNGVMKSNVSSRGRIIKLKGHTKAKVRS